jgi:hypothetical protein
MPPGLLASRPHRGSCAHQRKVGKDVFQRGLDVVQIGFEMGHGGTFGCVVLRRAFIGV